MLLGKNHLACYQNKDWCALSQIQPQTIPLFWKVYFTESASLVAVHPIKVDKCGGEIAKLATSSNKKAIETSEGKKYSCTMLVIMDTIQITTIRHATIIFNSFSPNSL